jgi:DnaJ-class molecular chaperone
MRLDSRNYYEVLEIQTNCTQDDINKSYTRARNSYSGDSAALYSLVSQDECDKMLNLIEEAYSILSIPEKRKEYDKVRGINSDSLITAHEKEKQSISDPFGYNNAVRESLPNNDLISETLNIHSQDRGNDFNHAYQNTNADSSDFILKSEHSKKTDIDVPRISAFKKFALDFEQDLEFEQIIENCTEFTGNFLTKVREYKNVSVERMADMTKVSKTYLKNIEGDNIEKLPALVYTRGFVYQYAKCLKLNPELVATSYLHHIKKLQSQA